MRTDVAMIHQEARKISETFAMKATSARIITDCRITIDGTACKATAEMFETLIGVNDMLLKRLDAQVAREAIFRDAIRNTPQEKKVSAMGFWEMLGYWLAVRSDRMR